MSPSPDRLLVGVLGAPHGVRGEMRLKSLTQDPLAIAGYPLSSEQGRSIRIVSARLLKNDILIARVEGVATRDQAAGMVDTRLFTARAKLPALEEEEFYHADLVGLRAENENGALLGRVTAVLNFGAGDILEIEPPDGGQALLLPFTRAVAPLVDIAAGRVVIVPPAAIDAKPDPAP